MRTRRINITVATDETGAVRVSYTDPDRYPTNGNRQEEARVYDRWGALFHLSGASKLVCVVTAEVPIPDYPLDIPEEIRGTLIVEDRPSDLVNNAHPALRAVPRDLALVSADFWDQFVCRGCGEGFAWPGEPCRTCEDLSDMRCIPSPTPEQVRLAL